MNPKIREKLAKIYALIERGSTEGEKEAARAALDRIIARENIDIDQLEDLTKQVKSFTYSSWLEYQLLFQLIKKLIDNRYEKPNRWSGTKTINFTLDYMDYVTIECAYEYFRRHMKAEWIRNCAPLVKRCRTTKGKNARRKALQRSFIATYFIASNLVDDSEITRTPITTQAQADRAAQIAGVRGGQYNKQTQSGHLLNQ